ncbi:hypothetical protein Ddye_013718 [Dipteronia dyeriana]|uniref:BED-type domain-containing protein n=1 Tax=Dipteronia dyeriana TaxID=168575 RepID=A0AAE0CJV0_9ROSI|nr:hypothetical protein Ddye_013718 [Dipteronia dyeriana]
MSTLDADQTLNQNKDSAWRYFSCPIANDKITTKCNFCGKVSKRGIFHAKQYLAACSKNVTHCACVPEQVKEEILDYMQKKKHEKEDKNLASKDEYDSFGIGEGDDLEMLSNKK